MIAQFRNGWLQSEQNAPTRYWNRLVCCYKKVELYSLCEGECSGVDVELLFVYYISKSLYVHIKNFANNSSNLGVNLHGHWKPTSD